jgi:hypothetical protein
MGCSGRKFTTRDEWYGCISKFAPGDVRDEQCGCDPSLYEPGEDPIVGAGKKKGGSRNLVDRVIEFITGGQDKLPVSSTPYTPTNTGVATPDIPSKILDPDNRPVSPGELTDGGIVPTVFYAPNKVLGPALKLVPEKYRVNFAIAFPWIFWLLLGGFIIQKVRGK